VEPDLTDVSENRAELDAQRDARIHEQALQLRAQDEEREPDRRWRIVRRRLALVAALIIGAYLLIGAYILERLVV
jgi:hypothetical protein